MRQFLLRPNDDEWFNLRQDQFAAVSRPQSVSSIQIDGYGDHRIAIGTVEVSSSYEDPGLQVCFEGEIEEDRANKIVEEVLSNITRGTGQPGRIVHL